MANRLAGWQFIGETALAAVGNSYEVTLIFIAFAFGCNIGCSVIVSQLFGAKQYRDVKTAVSTTLIASGVLCAILMLVGYFCCDSLLRLIRARKSDFAALASLASCNAWPKAWLASFKALRVRSSSRVSRVMSRPMTVARI